MIAILSYKGVFDTPYHKWIPERIDDVYIFCNSKIQNTYSEDIYKNKYSYENYNENLNLELDIINLHKQGKIEAIIALDEFDVGRAGMLRTYLGIDGQTSHSAKQFRDKLIMKDILSNNEITVTPYSEVSNLFDILGFIEMHDFPIVLKPRSMAGSIGVKIINNSFELKNFLANGVPSNFMIEKFVDGEMYHIDGLIINKEVKIIFPSKYRTDCIDWSKGGFTASYMLEEENKLYTPLCSFVKTSLNKMSLPEYSPFHAEVFVSNNGNFTFNEVGSRVPGGRSNYEFLQGTGLNLNEITVRQQCNLKVNELEAKRKIAGHIYIPPKKGKLINLPKKIPFDYIVEYNPEISMIGKSFNGAQDSVDCIATVICKGRTEKDIINNIDSVYSFFNKSSEWID
jgi:hypothetical protein